MKLIFSVDLVVLMLICFGKLTQAVCDSYKKAQAVKEGQIPYIVQIRVLHPHTGRFMPICAGAIISKHDVITNAVCASACQHPPNCKLYVGRVNLNSGGTEIKIKGTVWYDTYYELDLPSTLSREWRCNRVVNGTTRCFRPVVPLPVFDDLGIIHTEEIILTETVRIVKIWNDHLASFGEEKLLVASWAAGDDIKSVGFTEEPKFHDILKYGHTIGFTINNAQRTRFIIALASSGVRVEVNVCNGNMGVPVFYVNDTLELELCGIMGLEGIANYLTGIGYQPFSYMEWINKSMYVNSMDFANFRDENFYESSRSNPLPDTINMIIAFIIFILFHYNC